MTQPSNVLMQPNPTDADSERPLTLVEKLEQLSDKYLNQYKYYEDHADYSVGLFKEYASGHVWLSLEQPPSEVQDD